MRVFAAGSLRAVLTEAAAAFKAGGGGDLAFEFGPSGGLRERLARGAQADVFASANMEHPRALQEAGLAGPVRMFARNQLCALAPSRLGLMPETVLARMLDPAVRLGTSTPGNDPAGDYAWQVFERADKLRPGARETLSRKALQLVGGPDTPVPPANRTVYGMLMAENRADIFLTYSTNAMLAQKEEPALGIVALPPSLEVGAEYGLVTLKSASPAGQAFADFLLGAEGGSVLAAHGFSPPGN